MRLLLDPENMLSSANKNEKTEFLTFFYKRCMSHLVEPILSATRTGSLPKRENIRVVHILNLILEFLSNCVEHHTFHIKNFIINRDLLTPILVLLQSSHQFLVVAVIRFLRKIIGKGSFVQSTRRSFNWSIDWLIDFCFSFFPHCFLDVFLGLNEDFYNRYILKGDHFKPVIEVFLKNGRHYNLLNSAILELFEHIRADDIRILVIYVIGTYWDRLSAVNYANTFNQLHLRYTIHTSPAPVAADRPSTPDSTASSARSGSAARSNSVSKCFRRDDRDVDRDEEEWFELDEGEEGENNSGAGETPMEVTDENNGSVDGGGGGDGDAAAKVKLLPSTKSLPLVNTAPPVKRPMLVRT